MFKQSAPEQAKAFLLRSSKTLAVAESLTAGHLQSLIASVSGSSAYFLGGITAYTIPVKAHLLGVDQPAAAACNAVSAEIAAQMASGALKLFKSDFAIATTGYAEPSKEQHIKAPFAYISIASKEAANKTMTMEFHGGQRKRRQMQIATAAFALRAFVSHFGR